MISVINSYMNDIKRTEDGFYIGYIDTPELYKQFLADLKEVGFYFSVRDSEKFKEEGQFLFRCNKSNVPVPFSGSPFRREKNIMYQCAYGCQYYGKMKRNECCESDDPLICEKKQLRIRHSKKLGCKAKMAAKCIRIYLDYKISSDNAHWRLKREVISTLKRDLMSEDRKVNSLSRYFVKISEAEQHCHDPIHPKAALKRKLKLAKKSIFSPLEAVNAEDYMGGNEIHMLEAADINLGCDLSSQVITHVAEDESENLREQCQVKNKEILNLSYVCQDEEQLKELLVELTRVTGKLNDNAINSSEVVSVKPEEVEEEVCLSSDIPPSAVIDKELSFDIDDSKPMLFEKDIGLDIDKSIYFDCETTPTFEIKDGKRTAFMENDNLCLSSLHSKSLQKSVHANQVKVEMQTKTLSQDLLESSSVELLQSSGNNGDNFILLIY